MFDGHGGREVASYVEKHYKDYLTTSAPYKSGDFETALKESFLKVDEELEKEDGKKWLADLKRKNPPNKAPLFKLLGDINNTGASANGEQTME